ncbi:hypothetical protein ACS0TY_020236 [Phlomoides rotata]
MFNLLDRPFSFHRLTIDNERIILLDLIFWAHLITYVIFVVERLRGGGEGGTELGSEWQGNCKGSVAYDYMQNQSFEKSCKHRISPNSFVYL